VHAYIHTYTIKVNSIKRYVVTFRLWKVSPLRRQPAENTQESNGQETTLLFTCGIDSDHDEDKEDDGKGDNDEVEGGMLEDGQEGSGLAMGSRFERKMSQNIVWSSYRGVKEQAR
jgi:hypothetical protein